MSDEINRRRFRTWMQALPDPDPDAGGSGSGNDEVAWLDEIKSTSPGDDDEVAWLDETKRN